MALALVALEENMELFSLWNNRPLLHFPKANQVLARREASDQPMPERLVRWAAALEREQQEIAKKQEAVTHTRTQLDQDWQALEKKTSTLSEDRRRI